MTSQKPTTLYGNVGQKPILRSFPAIEKVETFHNEVIDGLDTRVVVLPAVDFKTFSVAVSCRDEKGQPTTSWVNVVDPQNLAGKALVAKGERVAITGTFEERKAKDGKTYRNFRISDLRVERRKPAPEIP